MQLRDYQQEAIDSIVKHAKEGVARQVIVLATGLGKTVIFGHLPSKVRDRGKKSLIIAHREELIDQAKEKMLAIDPTLKIAIEQGDRKAEDLEEPFDVVVASVPTIGRKGSARIKKFNPDEFGLIVIDECHHSTAETYKNVLEYFGVLKDSPEDAQSTKGKVLLGVTATPSRSDHIGLDHIFDKITFSYDLRKGIENKYLCDIKAFSIATRSDLSGLHSRMGDFVNEELAEAVNTDERNQLVVESYKELVPNTKALCFAADVDHVIKLTGWFQKAGFKAEFITGELDKDKRRDILERFEKGETEVLVNCNVLTEGYDCPSIQTILMARPTKSSVSYSQMIGRGTRLHPGKEYLNLIDFVDNTGKNQIATIHSLFGIPKTLKTGKDGKLVTKVNEMAQKVLELYPEYPLEEITDWSDEGIEKIVKRIDIFAQAELPEAVKTHSQYAWEHMVGGYKIQFPHKDNEPIQNILIVENMLGHHEVKTEMFEVVTPSFSNGFKKWNKLGEGKIGEFNTVAEAFKTADDWIRNNRSESVAMLNQDGKWRQDKPTEGQLNLLKKFGIAIPVNKEQEPLISKGQASVLISKAISERKARRQWR